MALRRSLLLVPVALALGACASLISFPDLGTEVSDAGVTTDAGGGDATLDGTPGDASRESGSGSGSGEGGLDAGSGSGSGAGCGQGNVSCRGKCQTSCALTLAENENAPTMLTAGGGWVFWATGSPNVDAGAFSGAIRAARADQADSAITLCDVTEPVGGLAYAGGALYFAVGPKIFVVDTIAPDAGAVGLGAESDAAITILVGNDASIAWSDSTGALWWSEAVAHAGAVSLHSLNAPPRNYTSMFATADRVYATVPSMTFGGAADAGAGSVISVPLVNGGTPILVAPQQTAPRSVSANGAYAAWINQASSDASMSGSTLVIHALDGGRESLVPTLSTPPQTPVINGSALWVWPRFARNSIEATALADGSTRPVVTDGGELAFLPPAFDATHMFWVGGSPNSPTASIQSLTPIPTP